MTKEQEAIETMRHWIDYEKQNKDKINKADELIDIQETVLNMLKEKDAEIEKYKKLLADNLAKELNNSIKAKEKADTDLDDLNKGWQVELEKYKQLYNKALSDSVTTAHDNIKKDKIIDLMAEQLIGLPVNKIKQDFEKPNFKAEITIFTDKEAIKQYFERKVENV